MNRADVGFVLGAAGFLISGFAVYVASAAKTSNRELLVEMRGTEESAQEDFENLATRVQDLAEKSEQMSKRIDRLDADIKTCAARLGPGVRMVQVQEDPPKDEPPKEEAPKDEGVKKPK